MMNLMRYLVQGFTWKMKMSNGALFNMWTPKDISRADARARLLEDAAHYDTRDIVNVWRCKG